MTLFSDLKNVLKFIHLPHCAMFVGYLRNLIKFCKTLSKSVIKALYFPYYGPKKSLFMTLEKSFRLSWGRAGCAEPGDVGFYTKINEISGGSALKRWPKTRKKGCFFWQMVSGKLHPFFYILRLNWILQAEIFKVTSLTPFLCCQRCCTCTTQCRIWAILWPFWLMSTCRHKTLILIFLLC